MNLCRERNQAYPLPTPGQRKRNVSHQDRGGGETGGFATAATQGVPLFREGVAKGMSQVDKENGALLNGASDAMMRTLQGLMPGEMIPAEKVKN